MSDTNSKPVATPMAAPLAQLAGRGPVVISIVAQFTFFLAMVAAAVIAWVRSDYTLLTAMAGVAATNATTVVSYWVGTSSESTSKTSILATKT